MCKYCTEEIIFGHPLVLYFVDQIQVFETTHMIVNIMTPPGICDSIAHPNIYSIFRFSQLYSDCVTTLIDMNW